MSSLNNIVRTANIISDAISPTSAEYISNTIVIKLNAFNSKYLFKIFPPLLQIYLIDVLQ